jgi:hypothetical protein
VVRDLRSLFCGVCGVRTNRPRHPGACSVHVAFGGIETAARSRRAAPQLEVAQVLDLLRRGRQYDALMSVADAALANDPAAPGIWRRYAQALIDSGRAAAALRIFTDVFEDPATSSDERIEARGGQGRC